MQDFMLFVKTVGDHMDRLSPEQQQNHLKKIQSYIGGLMESGKLKNAEPLELKGSYIVRKNGLITDGPFNESKEVIVGYFLISALDLNEAIEIAKINPILDITDCEIEVRPIKSIEGIN